MRGRGGGDGKRDLHGKSKHGRRSSSMSISVGLLSTASFALLFCFVTPLACYASTACDSACFNSLFLCLSCLPSVASACFNFVSGSCDPNVVLNSFVVVSPWCPSLSFPIAPGYKGVPDYAKYKGKRMSGQPHRESLEAGS